MKTATNAITLSSNSNSAQEHVNRSDSVDVEYVLDSEFEQELEDLDQQLLQDKFENQLVQRPARVLIQQQSIRPVPPLSFRTSRARFTTLATENVISTSDLTDSTRIPSISIIPITNAFDSRLHTRTGRLVSVSHKATSPPLIFTPEPTKEVSVVRNVSDVRREQPQKQHQYQQTDRCTIIKLDVLRSRALQGSGELLFARNLPLAASSRNLENATALILPAGALQLDDGLLQTNAILTNEFAEEEVLFEQSSSDEQGSPQQQQLTFQQTQQISFANQPIIVKIEPTQSFQIVNDSDSQVLSLPLTDGDKIGANWIDLKDIAQIQTGSSGIIDLCHDNSNLAQISQQSSDCDEPPIKIKRQQVTATIVRNISTQNSPALATTITTTRATNMPSLTNATTTTTTLTTNTNTDTNHTTTNSKTELNATSSRIVQLSVNNKATATTTKSSNANTKPITTSTIITTTTVNNKSIISITTSTNTSTTTSMATTTTSTSRES